VYELLDALMNDLGWIEIEQALARFLDGEPEPSDGEVLAAALRLDKGFEREIVLMLMVSDFLRQNALPDEGAFIRSLHSRLASEVDSSDFMRKLSRRLNNEEPAVKFVRPARRVVFGLVTVAVVVILMSGAALLGYRSRGTNPRWLRNSSAASDAEQFDPVTSPDTPGLKKAVAALTRVVDAHWSRADVTHNEGSALPPGHMQLVSGLIQVEFLSGASVIMEGPCDVELLSAYKAICHRGKLRAHVPPHARGFTIVAPGVNAVDLGTEFAMAVGEHKEGQIHVVEGEVELHSLGNQAAAVDMKTLKAGQGIDFGVDGVFRDIAADARDFVDYSRLVRLQHAQHLRRHELWLAHSRTLRADPATVLYYSFESSNTWDRTLRNVADRGDRSLDGSIVGCLWCPGRWQGKTALEFKRTSDRVRINVPGRFDQLSMATWVRIEGLNNWYSSLMLTDDWDPGEAHWQLTSTAQIVLGVHRTNQGHHNVDYGSSPILGPSYLGQWVHIATVYDKERMTVAHYLNGNRVYEERLHFPVTLGIGPATVGNWSQTRLSDDVPRIRSLNGRMDEFVILRRVLTAAEIKEMYDVGKPSS
jgi:Concanavalin A-like lectin/glucanases superfamily